MDAQIASISDSLARIDALHKHESAAQSQPQFFTNAVLGPARIDILELIRDADQLEASLFAPSSRAGDDAAERGTVASALSEAEQLVPQLRAIRMPTPLRKTRTPATTPGEPTPSGSGNTMDDAQYDAKTLLLAAEKLIEN